MRISPLDPSGVPHLLLPYADGPVEERRCTDLICLPFFVVNVVLMLAFAIYGYANGNPELLFTTTDSDGNVCGLGAATGYNYAYLANPLPTSTSYTAYDIITARMCVKQCVVDTNTTQTLDCLVNSKVPNCTPTFVVKSNDDQIPTSKYKNDGGIITTTPINITLIMYPTSPVLFHFCTLNENYRKPFSNQYTLNKNVFDQVFQISSVMDWSRDIYHSFTIIIAMIFTAIVVTILYIVALHYFQFATVISAMVMILMLMGALGYFMVETALYEQNQGNDPNPYKVGAICLWLSIGIIGIYLVCIYRKMNYGLRILEITIQYIFEYWVILIFMIISILLQLLFFAWWLITAMFILSSVPLNADKHSIFTSVNMQSSLQLGMFAYFVFAGIWTMLFNYTLIEFVLGSSGCLWYFGKQSVDTPHQPLLLSLYRAFRYHCGSLAFGCLFVWIASPIKLIVEFFDFQAPSCNPTCAEYCGKIGKCIIYPFRLFVEYFNRLGYIHMALSGEDFIYSSELAIATLWIEAKKTIVLGHIGDNLTAIANIFVSTFITCIFYLIITRSSLVENLTARAGPCFVVFKLSLIISILITDIISVTTTAYIQCFLVEYQSKGNNKSAVKCHAALLQLYQNEIEADQ